MSEIGAFLRAAPNCRAEVFKPGQRLESPSCLRPELAFERAEVAARAQLPAMLIDYAKVHEQVGRQHVQLQVGALDVQRRGVAHPLQHRVRQRATAKQLRLVQLFGHAGRRVGQRHQP